MSGDAHKATTEKPARVDYLYGGVRFPGKLEFRGCHKAHYEHATKIALSKDSASRSRS